MSKAKGRLFGPVGRCIYCGTTEGPLTDEHIVAANLGGDLILVKASCATCQKEINENVEQPCLRKMFRDIRYKRGIGSRRIKERPTLLPAYVSQSSNEPPLSPKHIRTSGAWEFKHIPNEEHPAFFGLMTFKSPGLLRGLSPEESQRDWFGRHWLYADEQVKPQYYMFVESGFHPLIFARMIAKIAHGFAMLYCGFDGFEPFLGDFILGKDTSRAFYLIGGEPHSDRPSEHALRIETFTARLASNQITYVMARVRLFANLTGMSGDGAPNYWVVVGKQLKNGPGFEPYRKPDRKQVNDL